MHGVAGDQRGREPPAGAAADAFIIDEKTPSSIFEAAPGPVGRSYWVYGNRSRHKNGGAGGMPVALTAMAWAMLVNTGTKFRWPWCRGKLRDISARVRAN